MLKVLEKHQNVNIGYIGQISKEELYDMWELINE